MFYALNERKYKLLRQRYEGYLFWDKKKEIGQLLKSLVEEDDSFYFSL